MEACVQETTVTQPEKVFNFSLSKGKFVPESKALRFVRVRLDDLLEM